MRRSVAMLFCAVLVLGLLACGGGGSNPSPSPGPVTVAISPATATMLVATTAKFTATVTGTSNTAVTFSVVEGANGGQITGTGDYLAGSNVGTFHVRATSVADPTKFANATVTIRDYANAIDRKPDAVNIYYRQTATLMSDGTVLVVGGRGFNGVNKQTETYIPAESRFQLGASLNSARLSHTANFLPSGKVLIAGGLDGTQVFNSTEIYDPAAGQFAMGPNMHFPHRDHQATSLKDGRVLITGGIQLLGTGFGATPNTDIYDPQTNTMTLGQTMKTGRWLHTATLLNDGRVLIVGGRDNNCGSTCPPTSYYALSSAEIYDPATGSFTLTGSLNTSRYSHVATLLPDGRVLILGGETYDSDGYIQVLKTGEIYNPATGQFTPFGTMDIERSQFTITLLNNGKYLLVGGNTVIDLPTFKTEIFSVQTGTSVAGPDMTDSRKLHTATRLNSGEVLIIGGFNSAAPSPTVELYR